MRIRSHIFTLPFNCQVTLGKSSPCLGLSIPIYSIRRVCSSYFIPSPTPPVPLPYSVPWKVGPCGLHHQTPCWLSSGDWRLEERDGGVSFPLPSFFGSHFRQHLGPSTASVLWAGLCVMLPVFNGPQYAPPPGFQQHNPRPLTTARPPTVVILGRLNTVVGTLAHLPSVLFLLRIQLGGILLPAGTSGNTGVGLLASIHFLGHIPGDKNYQFPYFFIFELIVAFKLPFPLKAGKVVNIEQPLHPTLLRVNVHCIWISQVHTCTHTPHPEVIPAGGRGTNHLSI